LEGRGEKEREREREKIAGGEFSHLIRARWSKGVGEGKRWDRKAQGLTSRNITKICKYIERQAVERAAGGRVEVG